MDKARFPLDSLPLARLFYIIHLHLPADFNQTSMTGLIRFPALIFEGNSQILSRDGIITCTASWANQRNVTCTWTFFSSHKHDYVLVYRVAICARCSYRHVCEIKGEREREIGREWHFQVTDSVPKIESSLGHMSLVCTKQEIWHDSVHWCGKISSLKSPILFWTNLNKLK